LLHGKWGRIVLIPTDKAKGRACGRKGNKNDHRDYECEKKREVSTNFAARVGAVKMEEWGVTT